MAVSPTPGQLEYVNDDARKSSPSLAIGVPSWMRILSLIIAGVGLVGNSIVLWLLGFRIPRNPFSVYILNLAGADALFLCSFFFFIFIERFVGYFPYVFECLITATFFYTVGLSLLTAISTERCLAVLFPSWYLQDRPKHTSAVVCAVLWALCIMFWVADLVFCSYVIHPFACFIFPDVLVVWLIHFTPVLGVSSLTLLLKVRCSSQRRQRPRLYLLVLLMVLVFLICGLPPGIQGGMRSLGLAFMPYWLLLLLVCVNSSANPFIYFLLGSRWPRIGREPLRVVLLRALADEHELESTRRHVPHQHPGDSILMIRRWSGTGAHEVSSLPQMHSTSHLPVRG
ncbi:mas-related G-protein coupled receptor member X4-like [Dromiciops gliroides]|uniref:mas-related G-protein coupled receptor member X4-like n=1 Tax=Dromiciops gliroides TaxID=33562 RepID=UPI001CC6CF00|nr:mas-related G-protein coupled receptor member X4-like [Dromiciops gliroides]